MEALDDPHLSCNNFPFRKDTGKLKIVKKHFFTFVKKQAMSFRTLNLAVKR